MWDSTEVCAGFSIFLMAQIRGSQSPGHGPVLGRSGQAANPQHGRLPDWKWLQTGKPQLSRARWRGCFRRAPGTTGFAPPTLPPHLVCNEILVFCVVTCTHTSSLDYTEHPQLPSMLRGSQTPKHLCLESDISLVCHFFVWMQGALEPTLHFTCYTKYLKSSPRQNTNKLILGVVNIYNVAVNTQNQIQLAILKNS